jgi:hypothetical protein
MEAPPYGGSALWNNLWRLRLMEAPPYGGSALWRLRLMEAPPYGIIYAPARDLVGEVGVYPQARKLHPKGLLRSARRFWGKNRGCEL